MFGELIQSAIALYDAIEHRVGEDVEKAENSLIWKIEKRHDGTVLDL